MSTVIDISLKKIRMIPEAQPRESINVETTADYAEAIQDGADFPPVIVFRKNGQCWLADGWHRLLAHEALGRKKIRAEVHEGDLRDAVLYSCGANAAHGIRRTNADKRRAVLKLLTDEEWGKWSNREIAKQAAVSYQTVNSLRKELSDKDCQIPTRKVTRGGTTYVQDTSKIGKSSTANSSPMAADGLTQEKIDALAPGFEDEYPQQTEITFQLIRALERIATMPVTPKRYDKICAPHSRFRVDKDLKRSVKWLNSLLEFWRFNVRPKTITNPGFRQNRGRGN